MKAHNYDIVTADSRFGLINQVNARIAQGWQPLGGVAHHDPFSNGSIMQAMILPVEEVERIKQSKKSAVEAWVPV